MPEQSLLFLWFIEINIVILKKFITYILGGLMKNILFVFFCVFLGVAIGSIARCFNASPLFQSLVISTGIAIVMFIYYQVTGVFK
ncbi:Uncharacterised protein [Serratia fonticola]|nr:Uncharacterised protein [Serratia fonticola]